MIDFETAIFNKVYPSVAPLCAKNGFRSTPPTTLSSFPTAVLYEMSNTTDTRRRGNGLVEEYAIVAYQVHVFAQSREKCREVFSALDEAMTGIGFMRFSGTYTPNMGNTKVVEYIARYRAEIDRNGVIYRHT